MSRFANPDATERLVLGPCECPGTPHDEDWMDLRSELGTQDVLAIAEVNGLGAMEFLIVRWNLLDNDGTDAPVDRAHIERLYADAFDQFNTWIEGHVRVATLPNGSGVRSVTGSRANAPHIRTTRKRR